MSYIVKRNRRDEEEEKRYAPPSVFNVVTTSWQLELVRNYSATHAVSAPIKQ